MPDVDVVVNEQSVTIAVQEEEGPTVEVEVPPVASAITVSVPGPAGPRGPAGELVEGTGDLHYTHVQGVPSADWPILHGLGKFPSVSFVDSSGQQVYGDVEYVNVDMVIGHFSAPFSGEAYAN